MITCLAGLVLTLLQVPSTSAASAQAPPSGSVEGVVRRVGTGEPVFRARVTLTLTGNSQPSTGVTSDRVPPRTATTDKSGHFVISGLDGGRYQLAAFADGYVRASYGQKGPNLPGTP